MAAMHAQAPPKGGLAWSLFSKFVSWGMMAIPRTTVASAELAFFLAPWLLRRWVERYTAERILACVVSGELPLVPGLDGGDAILFYPLPHCVRYALEGFPDFVPQPLMGGAILAYVVPPERRARRYRLTGFDRAGGRYDAGLLGSRGHRARTRVSDGVSVAGGRLRWPVRSKRYLTSFVLVYDEQGPKAAGYSRRRGWRFPATTFLPHVVIPPRGRALDPHRDHVLVMIVDTDAWVPDVELHRAPRRTQTR